MFHRIGSNGQVEEENHVLKSFASKKIFTFAEKFFSFLSLFEKEIRHFEFQAGYKIFDKLENEENYQLAAFASEGSA